MATRPEEENPMQKARRRQEELKALGRGQLVSAAASARQRAQQTAERGRQEAEDVTRAGGKAFAQAAGRQPGGIASIGGLGTLAMDTSARRAAAMRAADQAASEQAKEAEAKEQEVIKFDVEAEKSPDEIEADLQKVDDKLKSIAESSPGALGIGENETTMKQKIEQWALDTRPTKAEWNRMRDNAKSDYGVGEWDGFTGNAPLRIPKFGPDGRVSGF
jgi:hypothetical protein